MAVVKTRRGLGARPPQLKTGMTVSAPAAVQPMRPRGLGYTGREDDVGTIAAGMMGQDSLLMQKAAATGQQTAAQRGLMNSSLAVGAAQSAQLDYVVPMASQTAGQQFQKNLSGQGYQQDRGLANQAGRIEYGLQRSGAQLQRTQTRLEGGIQRQQTGLEAGLQRSQTRLEGGITRNLTGYEAELAREQAGYEAGLNRTQTEVEASLQRQQTQLQAKLAEDQARIEAQLQRNTDAGRLTADDRRGAEATMNNIFNDYQQQLNTINTNPNLSAEERAAQTQAAQDLVEDRMEMTSLMYGETFDWPAGMFGAV